MGDSNIRTDAFERCIVQGDGWCLYRALLVAKYIQEHPGTGCNSEEVKKYKTGNDNIVLGEITKLRDYIQKQIDDKTQPGIDISDNISLMISQSSSNKDANYYDRFKVIDVRSYLKAMLLQKPEKFFGDVQIIGYAFAHMNQINVNVYESVSQNPDKLRKSYPFRGQKFFQGKPTLHIYHEGRIHFEALIPKELSELQPPIQEPVGAIQQMQQASQLQGPPPPFPGDRPPSTFETVTLGPKSYNLPVEASDDEYRNQVFARLKAVPTEYEQLIAKLTSDEQAVLRDTGFIKQQFLIDHAEYMADFFKALPNCNTETSVMLHKQCDKSYFLIFALLHSAAQEAGEQMAEEKFVGDEELMRKGAAVSFFQKRLEPGEEPDTVRKLALQLIRLKNPNKTGTTSLLTSYANMKKATRSIVPTQPLVNTEAIVQELFTLRI